MGPVPWFSEMFPISCCRIFGGKRLDRGTTARHCGKERHQTACPMIPIPSHLVIDAFCKTGKTSA